MIPNASKLVFPLVALGALLGVSACELIASVDRTKINPAAGGAGAIGGAGGTGGIGGIDPTGGGGIGGAMCDPAECPAGTDCQTPDCVDGACGFVNDAVDTDCMVNSEAGACDAAGMCIAFSCSDDELSPGETDVDCGGPTCPACDNALSCAADTDCKSNNCTASGGGGGGGGGGAAGVCEPCVDGQCPVDTFCDAVQAMAADQICQPEKTRGSSCSELIGECDSGFCTDGVCCDSSCEGPCSSCALSGTEGTCTAHPDGASPETPGCPDDSCVGATLTTSACASGMCANMSMTCAGGYACTGGGSACRTTCTDSSHCQAGFFCDTVSNTCNPQVALGLACATGEPDECAGANTCVDAVCCSSACPGDCEACNLAGTEGTCTTVPDEAPGSCGGTDVCCSGACATGPTCGAGGGGGN